MSDRLLIFMLILFIPMFMLYYFLFLCFHFALSSDTRAQTNWNAYFMRFVVLTPFAKSLEVFAAAASRSQSIVCDIDSSARIWSLLVDKRCIEEQFINHLQNKERVGLIALNSAKQIRWFFTRPNIIMWDSISSISRGWKVQLSAESVINICVYWTKIAFAIIINNNKKQPLNLVQWQLNFMLKNIAPFIVIWSPI